MSYIGNGVGRSIVMPGQIAPAAVGVSQLDGNVAGVLGMFKNKIINGNFDIWQRGTAQTAGTAGGAFMADRWVGYTGTGATTNMTQGTFTIGQTAVPYQPTYYINYNTTVAATAPRIMFGQRIEDVRTFAGQTCVASGWFLAPNNKVLGVKINQNFGTGGSTLVNGSIQTITGTGSWSRFELAFTMPSIAGKTVGPNSYIEFLFTEESAFSTFTLSLAQLQLEVGMVSTPFEQRPIGIELTLCQRYYQRYSQLDSPGFGAQAAAYTAIDHLLPVTMRTTPTLTFQDDQGVAGQVQYVSTNGSNLSRGVPQGANNSTSAHLLIWDTAATKAFMRAFVVQLNAEF